MLSPALLLVALAGQPTPTFSAEDLEFFERRVRPVLVERCFECHSAKAKQVESGLLLDSRESVLRGGDTGPVAVAGEARQIRLIEAIGYQSGDLQMPPTGRLPAREIEALEEWVRRGLPFSPSQATAVTRRQIDIAAGRKHWAFQPVAERNLPLGKGSPSGERRIDHFVRMSLAQQGLASSPPVNRRVFIRRASFDLCGLPPAAEEVERFVADASPDACERVIDRLLASPHYGERWGRHWLDLVRYCDVAESWRQGQSQPWLYRDWVIGALNRDLPYDEFIRRQLAADLLPGAQPADNAALGLLGLSPTYWKELKLDHKVIKQVVAEEWEERIEALSGALLGLTVACARCHDHKFDPVTQQDYYALAGVLASIRQEDLPIIAPDLAAPAAEARRRVTDLQNQIDKLAKAKEQTDDLKQKQEELRRQIDEQKRTPHYDTPLAPGIADAAIAVLPDGPHRTKVEYRAGESQDVALHIRGNAANPGPVVSRRFLAVLASDPDARFENGSGRRQLAEAIVTDAAPLTARVIVNRVWLHHFGRGLVATPSNFGTTGQRPSHPELLDDLAAGFIRQGWSLKWLHREIVLSATYQQASVRDAACFAKDPDNIWLWRMQPRRLDVEAWRDAMLAATGELELSVGGSPSNLIRGDNRRRTVYGQVKRRELADVLRLFDFPDPVAHSAIRVATTTPLQQLFALNSPLLHERSSALAQRVLQEGPDDQEGRINWICNVVLGRRAAADEIALALRFVAAASGDGLSAEESWRQYCHALLASNELLFVE
jgi:hypothetical protein